MKRTLLLAAALWLCLAGTATAHLSNPSTLELKEIKPNRFRVVLSLPIIDGRVLKARPVLPDLCEVVGESTEHGTGASVVRAWTMECDSQQLTGLPVGVAGLLGTSQEVMLTIEMLDGRRHSQVLRPTQPFFLIPPPPSLWRVTWDSMREGLRRLVRRVEIGLLVFLIMLLHFRTRAVIAGLLAFVAAQALGQWLGGHNWLGVSPFLPRVLAALTALLAAVEVIGGRPLRGWLRPWWAAMLALGLLYGAAQPATFPAEGLSYVEQRLASALFAVGALAGISVLALAGREWRVITGWLPGQVRDRMAFWSAYLAGVSAAGWVWYQLSVPAFGGEVAPAVPALTAVVIVVFAMWCRMQGLKWLMPVGGFCFPIGMTLSFSGVTSPLVTLAVLGTLAALGASMLLPRRLPIGAALVIAVSTMFYQGYHAGDVLRSNTSLPVANAVGAIVVVGFLLYACYSAVQAKRHSKPVLAMGGLAVAMAFVGRLIEYRAWLGGPVAAELTMGLLRLPVITVLLLLAAGLFWPRRRQFQAESGSKPWLHWTLLAMAFFMLPHGDWRIRNPLYTPRAPTAVEAKRIMATLLSNTYLAFNVADENAAFDRMAENVSRDLVADVYLDSRRRLTTGTRQGAEVTVKDVSVMSVDQVLRSAGTDNAFTYPCKWIVTARVRHLQHIHNRQNVYVGELTIRVEDDRWKIARLNLTSEERVVLSWQQAT